MKKIKTIDPRLPLEFPERILRAHIKLRGQEAKTHPDDYMRQYAAKAVRDCRTVVELIEKHRHHSPRRTRRARR